MWGTYYYQYSIKDIVTMFHDGLQLAWKALPTQIPALEMDLATRLKNTIAPYFEYDYDKCRCS